MSESPARVEAFSDGVFAIAITLLILEIKVPHAEHGLWAGLLALWPSYVAFLMSFLVILIMWVNHHELRVAATRVHACRTCPRAPGVFSGTHRLPGRNGRGAAPAVARPRAQCLALDLMDSIGLPIRLATSCALIVSLAACQRANESHVDFVAMQARGEQVMGVDQYTSAHVFEDRPDGGRVVLDRADASDTAAITKIRAHLHDIEAAFRAGDFAKPFAVHAQTVPGTAVMTARRAAINYAAVDRPQGGEVRITSSDPVAIAAIHEFLAFQRQAHRAAGHEGSTP